MQDDARIAGGMVLTGLKCECFGLSVFIVRSDVCPQLSATPCRFWSLGLLLGQSWITWRQPTCQFISRHVSKVYHFLAMISPTCQLLATNKSVPQKPSPTFSEEILITKPIQLHSPGHAVSANGSLRLGRTRFPEPFRLTLRCPVLGFSGCMREIHRCSPKILAATQRDSKKMANTSHSRPGPTWAAGESSFLGHECHGTSCAWSGKVIVAEVAQRSHQIQVICRAEESRALHLEPSRVQRFRFRWNLSMSVQTYPNTFRNQVSMQDSHSPLRHSKGRTV